MKTPVKSFTRNAQFYKFCFYGFLKNLRFYEPFLFLFFLEQGLSFLQIGVLISIREIGRNLLEIPAGVVADAIGRKKTLVSSFLFYITAFFIYFFAINYGWFIAAMIFYSLGDSFRTGTHKAMIFDYLRLHNWKDQKVYYYGHTRSYSQLGSALSSLVAALLVFVSGEYRMIFLYTIIPYILDLFLILSYPDKLNGQVDEFKKDKILIRFKRVLGDFWVSFRKRRTLRILANTSLYTGYYQALKDYLQPVIKTLVLSLPFFLAFSDQQRTAILIGVIYFFIYILTSISARYAGKFVRLFDNLHIPMNLTLLIGLTVGLLSGLFFEFDWLVMSVVFFVVIYIIENLRKPIGVSYISETIDKDVLATVLSAESQSHTLVAALLAPLIGFLADSFGPGIAIIVAASIPLALMPVYWLRK
ncbi:MAG: MFS transporter [Bacteroidetes bacterium]|nr:MFS transporter [Bacteroidota bacterium]